MLRGRVNYPPDLDALDSPLVSPTPILLSGVPGSALAERIFNDPESWEDNDGDDSDIPEDIGLDDEFEWLADELMEKVRAGVGASSSPSTPTDKASLISTPTSASTARNRLSRESLKSLSKRGSVRPISLAALFEHSQDDFSGDIQQQLSKILESGGIPHHIRSYPPFTPSTGASTSSVDSTLTLSTALNSAASSDDISPVNIYSASTTLSFLEWYGIYPDSPRLDINGRRQQPKSARIITPSLKLQVPSPRPAMRPSPLLSPVLHDEDLAPSNTKLSSSVAPPGLDPPASFRPPPPPGLTRSPSPFKQGDIIQQNDSESEPSKERGRPLHMTLPASNSRTSSPVPSLFRSKTTASRDPTPVRGTSHDQPIRRLPSIPPESFVPCSSSNSNSRPSSPPQPLPQPPVQAELQTQTQSRPQLPPCPPSRNNTPSPVPAVQSARPVGTRQPQQSSQTVPRPASVRSPPLFGPVGPRTRSRSSQDTRIAAMGHRPPVLRL